MSTVSLGLGDRVTPYPDGAVDAYRQAGMWGTRTIPQELRRTAGLHPDRPAVVALDGRMTYRELDHATDRVAAGLHALGLEPGDRALFQLGNGLGTVLAWYGALKAGLIPVCTLLQHRRREIDAIAELSEARAHFVQADSPNFDLVAFARDVASRRPSLGTVLSVGTPRDDAGAIRIEELGAGIGDATARIVVDAIQATIDPDEVAVFQLSGGTTSVPKIIPRLHAEYWYNARAYAEFWEWGPDHRPIHLIPLIHNAGITCGLHAAHAVGARIVLGTPEPAGAAVLFEEEEVTDAILNLTLATIVLENERLRAAAVATLRRLVYSGSKLPDHVLGAFETERTRIVQLFGMGEGLFMVTPTAASGEMRHHTVGVPLSALDEVRVLDPGSEDEVALGEEGELCCRGPYTVRGYYAAPERNREAFTRDGFYRTGDLARAREIDGVVCYAIEGRVKDVISRGGEKVNAEEVELLLLEHPAVVAAAVVAMPDPRLGERACAYVVAAGGGPPGLEDLKLFLEQRGLAKYKWPERVEPIAALPLTNIGKIDKQALREDITARVVAEAASATEN